MMTTSFNSLICGVQGICRSWPQGKNAASSEYSTAVFLHTRHFVVAASCYLQIEQRSQLEPWQRTGIASSQRQQAA